MKNNKGFSLIELIVTIAILALFSTGVLAGLGYLEMANSQKCVAKIDSGLMTLKSRNMANSNRTYMHIYQSIWSLYQMILLKRIFCKQNPIY